MGLVVPRMGNLLVVDHELKEADVVVVLMGRVPVRTLEAVDLLEEDYSEKMLIVDSCREANELLAEKGIHLPGHGEQTEKVALELGVQEQNIKRLPGGARNTFDEAIAIKEYLEKKQDIDSLILVTSSHHTRRTYSIFKHALGTLDRDITLYSRASRYSFFEQDRWWQQRECTKALALEYLKLAHFYFWEQFTRKF